MIKDAEQARDIAAAIRRLPNLFSRDGRFEPKEIQSTQQFLLASAAPVPPGFDIRALIDDRWVRGSR